MSKQRTKRADFTVRQKRSLGLSVGDIVTVEHPGGTMSTPCRIVGLTEPRKVERPIGSVIVTPWAFVSVGLVEAGQRPRSGRWPYGINRIRPSLGPWGLPEDDPRRSPDLYLNEHGYRIEVERPPVLPSWIEPDLFALEPPEPADYPFQDGVDYWAGFGLVWKCCGCDRDFNAPGRGTASGVPYFPPAGGCTHCDVSIAPDKVILMPRRRSRAEQVESGEHDINSALLSIGLNQKQRASYDRLIAAERPDHIKPFLHVPH